jgi:chemotaxis family two-component system response regulator Rcp1
MEGSENQPFVEVLFVEDDKADARLAREVFRDVNSSVRLHFASDGVQAMAFLRREGVYADKPRPDLVLLDLNMPKMDGRAVLALIKKDESLKTIPTVVLSSSDVDADVLISYQLSANCYLRKPAQWDEFEHIIRCINSLWLSRLKLPNHGDAPFAA